jgi:hypothetical protein
MPKKHSVFIKVSPNDPPGSQFKYVNQLAGGDARKLRVKTGDGVLWRLRVFRPMQPPAEPPYLIYFKTTSPFATNVVNVPSGGLSQEQLVTDFLGGGHPYTVVIPSLDLSDDPEIQVDGLALDGALATLQDHTIQIERNGDVLTVTPPSLTVSANSQVDWRFVDKTGGASKGQKFTVHFDVLGETEGPFTDLDPVIEGRLDTPPNSASTALRQVNPVLANKTFQYNIEVENGPSQEGLTLEVVKTASAGTARS